MITTVLLDAVGTLIRPQPSVSDAYHSIASTYQIVVPAAQIQSRFAASYRKYFIGEGDLQTSESCEKELWQSLVSEVFMPHSVCAEMFDALWNHFADPRHWAVLPEVETALDELQQHGLKLHIASNFDARLHAIVSAKTELKPVEHIFVSTEIGIRKPAPLFYQTILHQLGLTSQQCVMIGDDPINDVSGAGSLRIRTLQIDAEHNLLQLAKQLIAWTD